MTEQISFGEVGSRTALELESARKNLLIREEYLRTVPVLSIREFDIAFDYIHEGQIFGVGLNSEIQFLPEFQFDEELLPKSCMSAALDHLYKAGLGGWEIAIWFDTENELLEGKKPSEVVDENPDSVIATAAAEMDIPH